MNDNCDLTIGPCACGAWHNEEWVQIMKQIKTLKSLYNMLGGDTKLKNPILPNLEGVRSENEQI